MRAAAHTAVTIEPLEPRRFLDAGGLDPSFGDGGKVASGILTDGGTAPHVAIQPDGAIMIYTFDGLFRYTAAGRRDTWFGDGGRALESDDWGPASVALEPGGNTLTYASLSTLNDPNALLRLSRYTTRGRLDRTFGDDGRVVVPRELGRDGQLFVQPGGRIVLAAQVLVRFLPDGSPDPSFGGAAGGGDGAVECPADFTPGARATTHDGKIVIVGTTSTRRVGPFDPTGPSEYFTDDTTVLRYLPDGTLDPSFGDGGVRYFDSEDETALYPQRPERIAVAADGAITALYSSGSGVSSVSFWRLRADGELDPTFGGGDGILTIVEDRDSDLGAIAMQSDGKILAAGHHNKERRYTGTTDSFQLVRRLNPDGSFDETFGGGGAGRAVFDFDGGELDRVQRVLLAPDGTILAVGASDSEITLARLWRDDGPAAQAIASGLFAPQSSPYRFRINWRDDQGVDLSSLDNGDVKAVAPDGSTRRVYFLGTYPAAEPRNFVGNFKIAAPDGAWDAADNGTWTIRVLSNHVSDSDGNLMRGRVLATFAVNIAAPAAQRKARPLGPSRAQAASNNLEDEEEDDEIVV